MIERLPDSRFRTLTPVPAWLVAVFDFAPEGSACTLSDALPFLDHFLPLADTAWHAYASETVDPDVHPHRGRPGAARASGGAHATRAQPSAAGAVDGAGRYASAPADGAQSELDHERLVSHITKVHAPAGDIDRGVVELLAAAASTPLTPEQQAAVDHLHQASARLQATLVGLPTPPRIGVRDDGNRRQRPTVPAPAVGHGQGARRPSHQRCAPAWAGAALKLP